MNFSEKPNRQQTRFFQYSNSRSLSKSWEKINQIEPFVIEKTAIICSLKTTAQPTFSFDGLVKDFYPRSLSKLNQNRIKPLKTVKILGFFVNFGVSLNIFNSEN